MRSGCVTIGVVGEDAVSDRHAPASAVRTNRPGESDKDRAGRPAGLGPITPATAVSAVAAALALIAVTSVVGVWLNQHGYPMQLFAPPLHAHVEPHAGWGTPLAIATIVVAAALQHRIATVSWRRLLCTGWLIMLSWMCSLTLVDRFPHGWIGVMTKRTEYLQALGRIHDPATFLAIFDHHILMEPHHWPTQVSGHPPLVTLMFWALARVGLPGGFWAGALCIAGSSLTVVAMPTALRSLGDEASARRLVPLAAVFPGAVWMAMSADGLFAGVATSGLALLCLGLQARPTRGALLGVAGGLLLGASLFLSYGLVLFGPVVAAVAWLTRSRDRSKRLIVWTCATAGVIAVWAVHRALGFSWLSGLAALRTRYYQGVAGSRPYAYFVFADLAAWLICCSPILAVVVVIAVRSLSRSSVRPESAQAGATAVAVLCLSGVAAVLVADVSGMSKGETERIWLPFSVVAFAGMSMLSGRAAHRALLVGAFCGLLAKHLLWTRW